jgi:uncharacterized NAD(P)/FAD-binding protein YdhS
LKERKKFLSKKLFGEYLSKFGDNLFKKKRKKKKRIRSVAYEYR